MKHLIKNVKLGGKNTDLLIDGNRFAKIAPSISDPDAEIIDGTDQAIIPSFVNMHTHAAMTLLRGYADDLALHDWLQNHIWPLEAKMDEEAIYHGTRLACLEMIKSGTTCFNDMYWFFHGTARAVEEMGLRATLSSVFIDFNDEQQAKKQQAETERLFQEARAYSDRIQFALGPHAIYTVSESSLIWIAAFSKQHNLPIHIHLSETQKEVDDCIEQHNLRPVEWLEKIGFLSDHILAAHAIHLSDNEIDLLAKHRVQVIFNPASNMKLASGSFPYARLKKAGVPILLGTDGCASNNNLDLLEEMKLAALQVKHTHQDPTVLSASEALEMVTTSATKALRIPAGKIEEGALADCLLIDLNNHRLCPGYHLESDLVYSADTSCIHTVFCNGKILMKNRIVPNEQEILSAVRSIKF